MKYTKNAFEFFKDLCELCEEFQENDRNGCFDEIPRDILNCDTHPLTALNGLLVCIDNDRDGCRIEHPKTLKEELHNIQTTAWCDANTARVNDLIRRYEEGL